MSTDGPGDNFSFNEGVGGNPSGEHPPPHQEHGQALQEGMEATPTAEPRFNLSRGVSSEGETAYERMILKPDLPEITDRLFLLLFCS